MADTHKAEGWHLDKKVPITLIFVLLAQLGAGIWFAGRTMQRADEQERRLASIEQDKVSLRMSVVESQLADVKAGVQASNQKLDRLIEKGQKP